MSTNSIQFDAVMQIKLISYGVVLCLYKDYKRVTRFPEQFCTRNRGAGGNFQFGLRGNLLSVKCTINLNCTIESPVINPNETFQARPAEWISSRDVVDCCNSCAKDCWTTFQNTTSNTVKPFKQIRIFIFN